MSALLVAAGMLLSPCVFVSWVKLYPEGYDPKNIDYVLWKHGLNANMNLDNAVAGMTHDTWAVNIVKGMSEEQLKSRFGYLRSAEMQRLTCDSAIRTLAPLGNLASLHTASKSCSCETAR